MDLQLKVTQPQSDFLQMEKRYRLFCAGYGAGKSEAMVQAAVMDAATSPGALIGCYQPSYDLIKLITAERITEKLTELGVRFKYNKQDNMVYTSTKQWGDFVFRSLDNPSRIVGYETYTAHVDEIDTLPAAHAEEAWNKVIARNRQQPERVNDPYNQASAYTTPEGFKFAHWRWVAQANDDYGIVQAPSYSNPYLPEGYIQSLRDSYPAALAEAYIEGQFVNLTSGTVYCNYHRLHCDSNEGIYSGERLHVGMDFNVGKMAAVVFVKRGEVFHAVDEFIDMYDTPTMAEAIKDRYPSHTIVVYPDASGVSRKSVDASRSDLAILRQAGFNIRAPRKNPAVKDRINAMNAALTHGRVKINSRACSELAQSLEQQAYDKNGYPDKQGGFDHINDAATYMVAYELPIVRPVSDVKIAFAM